MLLFYSRMAELPNALHSHTQYREAINAQYRTIAFAYDQSLARVVSC